MTGSDMTWNRDNAIGCCTGFHLLAEFMIATLSL